MSSEPHHGASPPGAHLGPTPGAGDGPPATNPVGAGTGVSTAAPGAAGDVAVALAVSRAIVGHDSAPPLLREVATALCRETGCRSVTCMLPLEGFRWEPVAVAGALELSRALAVLEPPPPSAIGRELALPGAGEAIALPLRSSAEECLGLIVLAPEGGRWGDSRPRADLLATIATVAGHALESLATRAELGRQVRLDPLTGLGNRNGLAERLWIEHQRSDRYGPGLAVLLCDLDAFKQINDRHGHLVGDEVLTAVGDLFQATIRATDYAARVGGDEFAVVLPHTDAESALALSERLRRGVQDLPQARRHRLTVSVGVAVHEGPDESPKQLMHRADEAMYAAKLAGRNRTTLHPSDPLDRAQVDTSELDDVDVLAVRSLVIAVDKDDRATRHASRRVGALARKLACELGLAPRVQRHLHLVGVLHDVGNIGVPTEILVTPGPLGDAERRLVRAHVHIGERILASVGLVAGGLWVRHHHERVDGAGYPDGLAGDAIPLESRILAVADAFGAMVSERSYREAISPAEAVAEVMRSAGQFDAACADALAAVVVGRGDAGERPPLRLMGC